MSLKGKLAQYFIILIVAALSLVLAAGIWRGKSRPVQQEAQNAPAPDAEMKLHDMEFTEMQDGKRFWTLCASEASYFQDQQKTRLLAVRLTLYLDKTNEQVQLDSDEGVMHAGTKDIELRGNIRVTLPRDYVVTTQRAHYTHGNRVVESDDPIHMSGPGLELNGKRWQYKIADHVAKVDGEVTASLVLHDLRVEK
ncbi:MAG TPA: LPS export ABC transporter periplasmic protein LptC [Syntrophobacteraceae bacterium]|nr:LPS export ABC transporter periplasmic protein LptC [Syntrophobacteraceae bacterium]